MAAAFLLPVIPLPLVKESVLHRGNKFLRRAAISAVIRLGAPGGRDQRAVMKIIVPQCIEAMATSGARANEPRLLRFVLAHHKGRPALPSAMHRVRDLAEHVRLG